jgi:cobalamin transport system ATP-binding protein
MNSKLEIKALSFGYSNNLILKNISFEVEEGEFVSIIGPNGSGKSTLLKCITNINKPKSGDVFIEGIKINDHKTKELAKKVAVVPQDTFIDFDFTVFDTVLMGRSPYISRFERETEEDFRITKEALKLTDTLGLRDRKISELSGGERQRVIIARALAQQPDIILLDEPTSHLDINHQMEVLNFLKELNKQNKMTLLIVIHDINLAARYSDKLVLLKDGEILDIGTPEDVITSENMEKAYEMNMLINHNLFTNSPHIIPLCSNKHIHEKVSNKRVHIICGGGTGSEVITTLEMKGYDISIGVVNIGDSDWDLSKKLSLKIVEETPFSEITPLSYSKNIEEISKSDVIVLTSVPYGNGNIKNLQAAQHGLELGKSVLLIDQYDRYDQFDYVEGNAKKLIEMMKEKGLVVVNSVERLLEVI